MRTLNKSWGVFLLSCPWVTGCGGSGGDAASLKEPQLPPTPAEYVAGQQLYESGCASCHDSSRDGAPRLGFFAAWKTRLEQGEEVLIQHALDGQGMMPPRGDNEEFSDNQIAEAVRYMRYRAELDIPADH